ncbi:hypothetical protein ACRAWF_39955 [Streptomyces sp. L7]
MAAPQASAAPSCWRDTCSGVDPVDAGCDADAETLQQVDEADESVEVELVWSPGLPGRVDEGLLRPFGLGRGRVRIVVDH